jgi:DNA-binding winged helix-turn-helix (wHTH) protein
MVWGQAMANYDARQGRAVLKKAQETPNLVTDTSRNVQFGPFALDAGTRQLRRHGTDIHLPRKAFELLWTLIAERPRVMSKQELQAAIWPDSHVDAAGLNVLVGDLRKALGDDAKSPTYIRTVHGVGFAFCGEVIGSAGASSADVSAWVVAGERTFRLSAGENAIGRDPGSAVWIDVPGVSRRHAAIEIDVNKTNARLRDLGSTNGTFIGRKSVAAGVELEDGDEFEVGPVSLTFRRWSPEKSADTRRIRRKSR